MSQLKIGNADIREAISVANGGSGQTTANAALNTFLPSQTSSSGKFLTTDGSNSSWATAGGSTTLTGVVTGSGTGTIATSLGSFSSAALAGALTDETGTGSAVFSNSPTLVTPALGTPASGVATNLTGTASGLTAGNVTTNANLTGPITSSGNATAIASQTGTGTTFVMSASPTITTAALGSSTATTQTPGDNSTKLATTAYVASAILGQDFKEACKYASTGALPAIVYANGSSGVGATLTGVALAAISLDSSSPSVNDRVLIKNQVSTFQNGIYTVTATGSGVAVFVLTRSTDFNQSFEINTGDSVFVSAGTTLSTTTWAYNAGDQPVIGTDPITFAQTAGQGSFTAGNGISITGTSIAIDTSVTVDKTTAQTLTNKSISGSQINSGTVPVAQLPLATSSTFGVVEPDNVTITISAGVISASSSGGLTIPQTMAIASLHL